MLSLECTVSNDGSRAHVTVALQQQQQHFILIPVQERFAENTLASLYPIRRSKFTICKQRMLTINYGALLFIGM